MEEPRLVENGVKYFFNETLKQCHAFKLSYRNGVFNIVLFCLFFGILACILIFKYKGKPTPLQKQEKEKEKQEYILSKIQKFQEHKKRAQQELITGLPHWDKPY
jgi:Na+-transporting NADH:ubiquinone oxidoreductase subunit NqrC